MKEQIKEAVRRKISSKGQLCIPSQFRNKDVRNYIVQKHEEDENGNAVLKLYPEDETNEDN